MIEKILTSKTLYQGQILNLSLSSVLLPNSRITNREIIEHANSVVVIALDNDDQLILVKQYRVSIGKLLLEFPAGSIENGEFQLKVKFHESVEGNYVKDYEKPEETPVKTGTSYNETKFAL